MGESLFLRDPGFHILAALAGGDRHGYGIMKVVAAQSEGSVHLSLGTLYGALERLAKKGAVEIVREERAGGRLRRYYHLTDSGADSLRREMALRSLLIETTLSSLDARRQATFTPLEA